MTDLLVQSEHLARIKPLDMLAYLRAAGWEQTEYEEGRFALWRKSGSEALTPLAPQFKDYAHRVKDLLQVLSDSEGRTESTIYTDLENATSDVARFRVQGSHTHQGSLPLQQGISLIEAAYEAIASAAMAVLEKRARYANARPPAVREYLARLELGQTERGSFVLPVRSPASLPLNAEIDLFGVPAPDFGRKTMRTLGYALDRLGAATERSVMVGTHAPFLEATSAGVSANLCAAIARLYRETQADVLDINITWAALARSDIGPMHSRFDGDRIQRIEDAAAWLRESQPVDDAELEGFIVALDSQNTLEIGGLVTLEAKWDGQWRKFKLDLQPAQYRLATEWHGSWQRVRAMGRIEKRGRSYYLAPLTAFGLAGGEISSGSAQPADEV